MIDRTIQSFVRHRVGGVIVNTADGEVVYRDDRIVLSDKSLALWLKRRPPIDEEKCWEFSDSENDKYYRIETAFVKEDNKTLQCHLFTDVSDYASLFKDISDYSRHISDVSDFQKGILLKLSMGYDACLKELAEFCHADEALLYMESENKETIEVSRFHNHMHHNIIPASTDTEVLLTARRFDLSDGRYCFLSDNTGGQRYSLFLRRGHDFNDEYFRDASVYNVIRLFIENGILRDKIIYESEHDRLTGLYNKDKYISCMEAAFENPEKITIFNFDLNNLKVVNDGKGHEAGDHLIVKAAESIRSILTDKMMGFRVGGDEFILVAPDVGVDQTDGLSMLWKKRLDEINEAEPGLDLSIACGIVSGEGDYDLGELLKEADRKMYEDKKRIKEEFGLPARGKDYE